MVGTPFSPQLGIPSKHFLPFEERKPQQKRHGFPPAANLHPAALTRMFRAQCFLGSVRQNRMHAAAATGGKSAAFSAAANFWHEDMCEAVAGSPAAAQASNTAGKQTLEKLQSSCCCSLGKQCCWQQTLGKYHGSCCCSKGKQCCWLAVHGEVSRQLLLQHSQAMLLASRPWGSYRSSCCCSIVKQCCCHSPPPPILDCSPPPSHLLKVHQ